MEKKTIRVMHICPLGTGGITNLVLNICDNINREIVNFDYLTYRDRKEFAEERALSYGGEKYIADNEHVKIKFMKFWVKFFRTYKVFKKSKSDIFHINASTPYDTLVGIAAKMAGVKKVVVHSHNASNSNTTPIKELTNSIGKTLMPLYTDAYFACSTEAAEYLLPKKVFKTHNYEYIKNGINTNRFKYDKGIRDKIRLEYHWNDKFVVCNVGRFSKQKNQALLIDVFYELTKIRDDAVLLLIGIGDLEESLKEKVNSYGINDKVVFLGSTHNVQDYLFASDVYVMTSLHEGLPVSGIEAQTTGLKCVFADTITREVDISGNSTFVSLDSSTKEWADIISAKTSTDTERNEGVTKTINAGFDIATVAQKLSDFYNNLLKV